MNNNNINIGICATRKKLGEPSIFVNWHDEDGEHFDFFKHKLAANGFKNLLVNNAILVKHYLKS